MDVAKQLGLSAVNFWYWDGVRRYMPEFWDLVHDYQYDNPIPELSQAQKYIAALNSHDPDKVLSQYSENAVQIHSGGAIQGKEAIRTRIASLIADYSMVSLNFWVNPGTKISSVCNGKPVHLPDTAYRDRIHSDCWMT